jgi:hypothetical protein
MTARRKCSSRALFACGLSLVTACLFSLQSAASPRVSPPDCSETRAIVHAGVDWLLRGQGTDGLFVYERAPHEPADRPTQNLTRQVGTLWGLIRSLEIDDRPEVRASVDRARTGIAAYARTNKSPEGQIAFLEEKGIAKLNAAALYLLALVELKDRGFSLSAAEEKHIPMLASGLRQMREEDGGFRYLYFVPTHANRITSYGSAEAVLALAAYAHQSGDEVLRDFAHDSFQLYYDAYLSAEGFDSTNLRGYFSWSLHAQTLLANDARTDYEDRVRPMLVKALTFRRANSECMGKGCIVAPQATDIPFLEGVLAALPLVRRFETNRALIEETETYAAQALRHAGSLQMTQEDAALLTASPRQADELIGGFCSDADCAMMRNDLTQHALIAFITHYREACAA